MTFRTIVACCLGVALLAAAPAGGSEPPKLTGLASVYAAKFHGRETTSGEIFDAEDLTAAHRTLPFGTRVRVHSLRSGRSVVVRINDRGPHIAGRVIDLSPAAARALRFRTGLIRVRLEVLPREEKPLLCLM
jgi:rare lipoprotein A